MTKHKIYLKEVDRLMLIHAMAFYIKKNIVEYGSKVPEALEDMLDNFGIKKEVHEEVANHGK